MWIMMPKIHFKLIGGVNFKSFEQDRVTIQNGVSTDLVKRHFNNTDIFSSSIIKKGLNFTKSPVKKPSGNYAD